MANRTVHSYHDALDVEALATYLKDRRWNKTIASTASSPSTVPAGTAANVAVLRAFVPNLTFQLPLVENGWSQFQVLQIKAYHIVVQLGVGSTCVTLYLFGC